MQLQSPPTVEMETALLVDGGFTYDLHTATFIRADQYDSPMGYAVAIPDLLTGLFTDDDPTVFIGGWIDPRNDQPVIEATQILNVTLAKAIALGIERGQYSIMNMLTGEEIVLAPFASTSTDSNQGE